jgi:ketol-acid reductoisomerase
MQILSDSFEVLVEAGFPPEILVLEYFASGEMAEIANAMAEVGAFKQMSYHSHTSQYGTLSRGRRVVPGSVRWTLQKVLRDEIQSGEFAKEWSREQENGLPNFRRLKDATQEHPITEGEERLRELLGKKTDG